MSFLSKLLGTDVHGDEQTAAKFLAQKTGAYDNIQTPDIKNPTLSQYADLGSYKPSTITAPDLPNPDKIASQAIDPRLAAYSGVNGSAFDNVSSDPRLQAKQADTLAALDNISKSGGLTAADKANLNQIQMAAAQADKGRRDAIQQNMQARGMGSSGMDLLSQLQSSQAATDRQNQAGLGIAGEAQDRALNAIMQSGQLAGGMRGQDFGEQSQVAQAQDAINKFNAGNSLTNNQFNAKQGNDAAQFNAGQNLRSQEVNSAQGMDAAKQRAGLGMEAQQYNANALTGAAKYGTTNSQAVANANTGIANTQAQGVNQAQQANFQNNMGLANAKAGVAQAGVDYNQGLADRKAKKEGSYLDAGIKAGAAYLGAPTKKPNPDDSEE